MRDAFGRSENEYSRLVAKTNNKMLNQLWEKKKIPEEAWTDHSLELFLAWLASHDTNNRMDMNPLGAGEREGRVKSAFVRRLHCNLSHGIGRSGNLCEIQPKALGSSMLNCLANEFALHSLHTLGLTCARGALVVPVATGMALMLCMGSWRKARPNAKYVVWLRVDQKSCFKSILTAGYEPLVVDPIRVGDALVTDIERLNALVEEKGEEILCVLSTTSAFAPRAPDDIEAIAAICRTHDIFHLVNNAYGLQSTECIRRLNNAKNSGRMDAFVQSLDKNFQVPVGGAIIATTKQSQAASIAQFYPGRASCVPSRDFVLTCLSQGIRSLLEGFEDQHRLFEKMRRKLRAFADEIGENVYDVPDNKISLAMTLSTIPPEKQTLFGSILFSRGITGARVVMSTTKVSRVENYEFLNFGSHTNEQHGGYLAMACGVGMIDGELDELFTRLSSTYLRFIHKVTHSAKAHSTSFDVDRDEFSETDKD
ncbi:unnamed protein product, partial [Mesorhabditis belari]|uniref:O-phosphoseryl-tRNA(Sec) selenium transferase n=1 Tax=Mesorhabditis belari TaxID=2138241 RepID=A0AAF3ESE1_9BILA